MRKYLLVGLISCLFLFSASFVFAQHTACDPANPGQSQLCNPISSSANLPDLLLNLLKAFTTFFGITTIVMVVFAGFRMMISMGNPQALTVAKSALTWSLAGFILAMFAFAIVMAMSTYLGVIPIDLTDFEQKTQVVNILGSSNTMDLFVKILNGFLAIASSLALLMIIVSGFRYGVAAGNEQQATSAKQSLQWAIIGLVVIIFGYVIVKATATFFGGH